MRELSECEPKFRGKMRLWDFISTTVRRGEELIHHVFQRFCSSFVAEGISLLGAVDSFQHVRAQICYW